MQVHLDDTFARYTLRVWTHPPRVGGRTERVHERDESRLLALLRRLAGTSPTLTLRPILLDLGADVHLIDDETALLGRVVRYIMRGELVLERESLRPMASEVHVHRTDYEPPEQEIYEGVSLQVHARVSEPPNIIVAVRVKPPPTFEVQALVEPPPTLILSYRVEAPPAP